MPWSVAKMNRRQLVPARRSVSFRCSSEPQGQLASGGQRLQLQELCRPDCGRQRDTDHTSVMNPSLIEGAAGESGAGGDETQAGSEPEDMPSLRSFSTKVVRRSDSRR